ncbi:Hypothetical protein R9X50_00040200 [Acrodontium crateriforme]|uniref:RGS domain-containing protein n=1 Tax=Acrodontium crateriforme TaxID=150365 RepID=A0AAQ3M083_9PEZI|nr:Hypothetical protein R9X50_00040200 [Acrodontium crateriforme]
MVYSLSYRRPSHRTSSCESLSGEDKQKSINESIESGSSTVSSGIPDALSFDRIIAGGTCPPCTVRDFMNYLKYIEHSAENLQFFLWFKDYSDRFGKLPENEKSLAPEWTKAQAEAELATQVPNRRSHHQIATAVIRDSEHADSNRTAQAEMVNPFYAPSKASEDERRDVNSEYGSSMGDEKTFGTASSHAAVADEAFHDAGMKWKPFTLQPYRDEITRVISTYIAMGSPRELNLSSRERQSILHALQNTTHPSAFRTAVQTAEFSLRKQAHPNFIRWTICNGNRPRVVFARILGVGGILIGFLADLLITLSHAGRAWRVLPFIGWFVGVASLIAGWKGMCIVLHGMHHRHLRPWELFSDEPERVVDEKNTSRDSLLSSSTNSYEDEPWVARYQKRNIVRKVFDREVWVIEPALRQIQDTIFMQAILAGFIASCTAVGIFCAIPHGNLY